MPSSIASQIARHLETDAYETANVIEALTQDIRRQVAQEGKADVPGLGVFRSFGGRIVFEPERTLALEVNQRYAGLEPLLVNPAEPAPSVPAAGNGELSQDPALTEDEDYPAEVPSLAVHPQDEAMPDPEDEDRIETTALEISAREDAPPADTTDFTEEDAGSAGPPPEVSVHEPEEPGTDDYDPSFAEAATSATGAAYLSREQDESGDKAWDGEMDEPAEEPALPPPPAADTPFFEPWPYEMEATADTPEPVADEPEADTYDFIESDKEAEVSPDVRRVLDEYEDEDEDDQAEVNEDAQEAALFFREEDEADDMPQNATFRPAPIDEEPRDYAGSYVIPSPESAEPEPHPAAGHRRSRAPLILAAVVLLALLGILAFALTRPAQQPPSSTEIAEGDPLPVAPLDTAAATVTPADSVVAVSEPAVPEPAPPSTPLRPAGGIDVDEGGLTLVVASVPGRDTALQTAERFRNAGYEPAIFYGAYGGVTRYRVSIGQFVDENEAQAQRSDLPDLFPDDAWLMPIQSDMVVIE